MALTAAAAMGAFAQNPGSVPNSLPTPGSVATVSVHGNVLNAANGQPVRRALVKTDGTPERGAVTDESGRFEIRGVPEGVVEFRIAKPGFQNSADADFFDSSQPHRVRVGSGMPDLSFSIAPFGSISGHVTLSDDLPAQGIGLILMRKTMSGGREEWEVGERHQATPDGAFRFSGVRAGTYLLLTEPAFENGDAAEPSCNAAAPAEIPGFAAQFYSDAQDIQGAEPIDVAPGQAAEVNLALRLTPLHLVQIAVSGVPAGDDEHFSPILLDRGGQMLGYPVRLPAGWLVYGFGFEHGRRCGGQDGWSAGERREAVDGRAELQRGWAGGTWPEGVSHAGFGHARSHPLRARTAASPQAG